MYLFYFVVQNVLNMVATRENGESLSKYAVINGTNRN